MPSFQDYISALTSGLPTSDEDSKKYGIQSIPVLSEMANTFGESPEQRQARLDNLFTGSPTTTPVNNALDRADNTFLNQELTGDPNQNSSPNTPDPNSLQAILASAPQTAVPATTSPRMPSTQPDANSSGAAPKAARAKSSVDTKKQVQDLIAQKYGFGQGLDDDALKSAQELGAKQRFNATIGGGIATLANALAGSTKQADLAPFQEMANEAGEPAKDIQARRAGVIQNLGLQEKQEALDSNSPKAKMLRGMINKLYPGQFKPGDLDSLAADDFPLIMKPLELKEAINARKQAAADSLAARKIALLSAQNEKNLGRQQAGQKALNDDQEYKDAMKGIDEARSLDSQADLALTNPRAASQLPIQIARTMTNRINDRELQASTGGQDIEGVASRIANKLKNGTLDKQDYQQLKQWVGVLKNSQQSALNSAVGRHVTQYSRLSGNTPQQAAYELGVNLPEAPRSTNSAYAPGSVIRVKGKTYRVGADGDSLEPM